MQENFHVFDFKLTKEDMKEIEKLDTEDSLFFSHQDPQMLEWFDKMIIERRNNK